MKISKIIFSLLYISFFGSSGFSQTIGTFNSVQPTAQTENLVLPSTHTFQFIIRSGDPLSLGGNVANNIDFTGYVPIGGSSTNGYLAISSEVDPGSCAILSITLNPGTKLWGINNGGDVSLPFADLGLVRNLCAGTITPGGHLLACEESASASDGNGDGYNDDGWIIEIDPATRTVVNQDGSGGVDKLWAMGRQIHEDVAVKSDQSVAYWSADDVNNGFIYKFVPTVAGNFSSGSLYVLQTTGALGTGTWQLVANTTQANRNGTVSLSIAAGAYNFSRVEGIDLGPDGKLYFASTITGTIYRFRDLGTSVDQLEVFVAPANFDVDGAGPFPPEPWGIGADNIAFDGDGNLWVLQDGDKNYIWVVGPSHTAATPNVRLFATIPLGSEPTGISFSPDYKYLFMSIQHPDINTTPQTDAAGNAVVFSDLATAIVIARKENLGSFVLPVNFISFNAIQKQQGVELSWKTGTIPDGDFEVERSIDGVHFESIGKVTKKNTEFNFIDKNFPLTPVVYYRLKLNERNGNIQYSAIKSIHLQEQNSIIKLYPSPSFDKLYLEYYSFSAGQTNLKIINAAGVIVQRQLRQMNNGKNNFMLDINSLATGTYHVIIEKGDNKVSSSFVKM